MLFRSVAPAAIAAAAMVSLAPSAPAAVLNAGTYQLHNHPDGSERPPLYGARFDELYNSTSNHDVFTLDFDHAQSAMFLTINTARTEIHIFGQAWGGRDTGTAYAADNNLGLYLLDFTYNLGVGLAPGDDDLIAAMPDMRNFGTIVTPRGDTVHLLDKGMDGISFRLGDEDSDNGHRGFHGISGWGWMNYVRDGRVQDHVDSTDWLFTASRVEIPAPGSVALMGVGGLLLARRRR